MRERFIALVAAGNCGNCGAVRGVKARDGATRTLCKACADKDRERYTVRYRARVAEGKCATCAIPHCYNHPNGKRSIRCAACALKERKGSRVRRAKKPGYQAPFGPALTDAPRYRGRGARRLGAWKAVHFSINPPTLDAINSLKRRYMEAHPGTTWRDHLSQILRDAIAGVLRKGGPIPVERERLFLGGCRFTLRLPLAQYQQITHIAKEKFGGCRALAVRVALRQAVNPPLIIAYGKKRVLGGRVRTDWDYD